MKPKLKMITIEDIALQFIKRNEPIKKKIINSSKTLIDKFCIKKNPTKNDENSIYNNSDSLLDLENKENISLIANKMKIIKFYKIPQKILKEDDEYSFNSELNNESISEIKSQRTYKIFNENNIKFRNIIKLNNNNINLNYQNIYNSITEIYSPLMQNFESISSLKLMTNNTLSCIEYYFNNKSIFDIDEKDILFEYFNQLKIYENIEINIILFIIHIILEAKIEYLDSINEDDILVIYHDCNTIIQKFYEIIILIILLKDNLNNNKKIKKDNNESISFESLCLKYVKDYFKFSQKPNNNDNIINKINENIIIINKLLLNSCAILYGNLIIFKKDSGNLDNPDKIELFFLNKFNNENIYINRKEKLYLSKEFNDQYILYKTIYLFFLKKEEDEKEENIEYKSIINKLNTMNSSFKEIYNLSILYYNNFKNILEKNKVKAPFLPPLDTNKYKY